MKTLFLLTGLLTAFRAEADPVRYATITTLTTGYAEGGSTIYRGTNDMTIADGESGQVVSILTQPDAYEAFAYIQKDGKTYLAASRISPESPIVRGPAKFVLTLSSGPNNNSASAFMTVKITPQAYDPNKTVIVPPGTNQVAITMESSTNLVIWADATNGIYGSPDTARFFRIRMDKL